MKGPVARIVGIDGKPLRRSFDRVSGQSPLHLLHAWSGLAAIGQVVRTREIGTKMTTETGCYLLCAALSAERFSDVARAQGGVENSLPWELDVTMNEDQARNRRDHGPENIALLRWLALNLAKIEGSKGFMKGKLKRAGWNDALLAKLPASFRPDQMR